MFGLNQCAISYEEEYKTLDDYVGGMQRWCPGCGDNGILTAAQKLCRDEQLLPEKTVFVSGIGCASRFPHYMRTYGFHGLHGRALPTAQGIKIRRPDLDVFVNMGDGDCCSIGTAHWIHAVRMNMNMVVMLHDNGIYGLTKKQASPTTPQGLSTNTTPRGAFLPALCPLSTTLGITNASFVAQVPEWIPELLYEVIQKAFYHKGFSFIRILQRCPHFTPDLFTAAMKNPDNIILLRHENGMQVSDAMAKFYKNHEEHDPLDMTRARQLADLKDKVAVGILYQDPDAVCYEDLRKPTCAATVEQREAVLEEAFDKFGIFPKAFEVISIGNNEGA